MKNFRIVLLFALVVALFTYSGCGGDSTPEEPLSDQQLSKLAKTWKVQSVTLDGVDKTSDYNAFQIVLSGTKGNTSFGYNTSGRPTLSPWKSSGAWEFGTDVKTQIIRDKGTADELAMTYSVTESTLQITFTFSGSGYTSRTGVVKGQWVYNMKL